MTFCGKELCRLELLLINEGCMESFFCWLICKNSEIRDLHALELSD